MNESIQKLTHVEHILKRPDSYVGPVARVAEPYWLYDNGSFENKNVLYSPALLKIFDEILVNAIDRNSMYPKNVTSLGVSINKITGEISVENNGPLGGISVKMHEKEGLWNPELTFGHLLTSTNYDDTQKRLVGGRNGYGAKLTNVYSSKFCNFLVFPPKPGRGYLMYVCATLTPYAIFNVGVQALTILNDFNIYTRFSYTNPNPNTDLTDLTPKSHRF